MGANFGICTGAAPPGFMGMGRRDPYEMMNRMADDEFRRRDINGDGFLNLDEMPDGIKNELARWDKEGVKHARDGAWVNAQLRTAVDKFRQSVERGRGEGRRSFVE